MAQGGVCRVLGDWAGSWGTTVIWRGDGGEGTPEPKTHKLRRRVKPAQAAVIGPTPHCRVCGGRGRSSTAMGTGLGEAEPRQYVSTEECGYGGDSTLSGHSCLEGRRACQQSGNGGVVWTEASAVRSGRLPCLGGRVGRLGLDVPRVDICKCSFRGCVSKSDFKRIKNLEFVV